MTPKMIEIVFREYFPFAVNAETIISYKLKEDVKIANKNNSKKSDKKIVPKGISPNAAGKTINSNGGPSSGAKPKAKTTGKIASPANKDKIGRASCREREEE